MVLGNDGSSSEKGFGQRDEQNWSWVNQSIIAVTHRLTRPVNYNQDDPNKPPRTMNLADLSFKTANWIVLAISFLIGVGYLAVMPAASRVTGSNAEELGILFCLMTVGRRWPVSIISCGCSFRHYPDPSGGL
jgi:hypothetical protein